MSGFFRLKMKTIFSLLVAALFSFSAFGQAGLTLGGKFVPRDSIYLYLFFGNSVMSGRDTPPDTITDNHAWKYVMTNSCGTYTKTCPPQYSWQPGVDPICFDSKNPDGGVVKYSPGTSFLKRMVKDYPGYHFGVAQLSGSAWKFNGHFSPTAADYKAMKTQALALKPNVHIAGIIMIFNIVEIQYATTDSTNVDVVNYFNNIDTMITHFRADVGIDSLPLIQSDYPILAGKDSIANYAIKGPYAPSIRVLMRNNAKIPQLIKQAVLIPTDSLTMYKLDGLYTHYDHKGDIKWANRVADSICARNWGPVNKCGSTGLEASVKRSGMTPHSCATQKVFFDGYNWSVFEKTGKSFEIFLPNGKSFIFAGSPDLKSRKLRPGVYIIRFDRKRQGY
jgi:hypothetical protein